MFYDYDVTDEAPTSVYLGKNNNKKPKKLEMLTLIDFQQMGNNCVVFYLLSCGPTLL